MINLKNLKSLFVVTEEGGKKEATTGKSKGSKSTTNSGRKGTKTTTKKTDAKMTSGKSTNTKNKDTAKSKTTATTPKASTQSTPDIDQKSYEKLMQAIEANNIEGFDYLEFKSSLNALKDAPLDEKTKYTSAFAMAATLGLTSEKLLTSAKFYQGILDNEKEKFKQHLRTQIEQRIVAKESERNKLNASIREKSEMIKKLTEEIKQHQGDLANVEGEIDDIKCKVSEAKDRFLNTYNFLIAQFKKDTEKIKQYLS